MTQANINTAAYWNDRFLSGHWEEVGGRAQTRDFAEAQLRAIGLPRSFSGSLLDFGCGLGDAFPVYRKAFPDARLIGMDVSSAAIDKCNERFPRLAQFLQGDHTMVPPVDVIVASNVLEHLSNDIEVATSLRSRCKALHIIVPFREDPRIDEHVHTYGQAGTFAHWGGHANAYMHREDGANTGGARCGSISISESGQAAHRSAKSPAKNADHLQLP